VPLARDVCKLKFKLTKSNSRVFSGILRVSRVHIAAVRSVNNCLEYNCIDRPTGGAEILFDSTLNNSPPSSRRPEGGRDRHRRDVTDPLSDLDIDTTFVPDVSIHVLLNCAVYHF